MKKLSGGEGLEGGGGLVKYAKQARKCNEGSKGRGKFDKVRLEWEDGEGEREKTRGGKRKRKAEVLAMPYPTLLLYFSSNISNIDSRPKRQHNRLAFPLPFPLLVPFQMCGTNGDVCFLNFRPSATLNKNQNFNIAYTSLSLFEIKVLVLSPKQSSIA